MRHLHGFFIAALLVFLLGCGGGGEQSGRSELGRSPAQPETKENDGGTRSDSGDETDDDISTDGWGDLIGRFVVSGAPEPNAIKVTGDDVAYCGNFNLVDESVVAGPDGGLANVVLMLYTPRREDPPVAHKQYAAEAEAVVELDNSKCRFDPRVVLLRTTQTLKINNSDTVGHNTKINASARSINPIVPPNGSIEEQFTVEERVPASAGCSIHPWMRGWLVIRESPYMVVTDEKGEFLIENLPAGKHTFQVWHEKGDFLSEVTVDGSAANWSRGRVDVIIKDGENTDLGQVEVAYRQLAGG